MAQQILDLFPNVISDYGLIGCFLSLYVPGITAVMIWLAVSRWR